MLGIIIKHQLHMNHQDQVQTYTHDGPTPVQKPSLKAIEESYLDKIAISVHGTSKFKRSPLCVTQQPTPVNAFLTSTARVKDTARIDEAMERTSLDQGLMMSRVIKSLLLLLYLVMFRFNCI